MINVGIKDQSEEEVKYDYQDLPNILDLIPSLVQVPEWCNNGDAESSAAQSSAVSTDDNYKGFHDHNPQLPSFDHDADGDWNPGCYNWDNLPKIY